MHAALNKIIPELEQEAVKNGISKDRLTMMIDGSETTNGLPKELKSKIRIVGYICGMEAVINRRHPFGR
jgi:hypothetical protein